ncbi:hypothetical protein, partial [Streptomyces sp. NPDC058656]|uniref:hypothetical protein n=1 Tax=Streptomyces sp. NPDC058656 TaxID=3346578 RepID=UPI00365D5EF1
SEVRALARMVSNWPGEGRKQKPEKTIRAAATAQSLLDSEFVHTSEPREKTCMISTLIQKASVAETLTGSR